MENVESDSFENCGCTIFYPENKPVYEMKHEEVGKLMNELIEHAKTRIPHELFHHVVFRLSSIDYPNVSNHKANASWEYKTHADISKP